MTTTGWTGEPPDEQAPAMPLTAQLLANRTPGAGDALEIAAARSRAADARQARDEAAAAPDPDELAAAMINRGYMPGMTADLSQRLGDTLAELEAERDKITRSERHQERLAREHAAGRLSAFDIAGLPDADEGDVARAERLERRADSLRRQLADAQTAISPQREQVADGVEAASRDAHQLFVEITRHEMAAAEAGRPEPRPFASVSRGAAGDEHTGPGCEVCAAGRRMAAERDMQTAARDYDMAYR